MAHIGLAVYDWDGLIGYTAEPVSKSAAAAWLKRDGFYANGGNGLKVDGAAEAEQLFATYGREQNAPAPVAKRAARSQKQTWTCHYCGMPAARLDFYGAPVCDDCSH